MIRRFVGLAFVQERHVNANVIGATQRLLELHVLNIRRLVLRASVPTMENPNSGVSSVRTSGVFVNGTLYLLASARLMLSKPTAICATTFNVPFPASKTSASIGSRSVVIKPSMPLFIFS